MRYQVTAPVAGYSGDAAGVHLHDGTYTGELGPSALAYFTEAGYDVEPLGDVDQADADPDPADPDPGATADPDPVEQPKAAAGRRK